MKGNQDPTDRYLRTFVKYLGQHRIGQHFMKSVSSSMDRRSPQKFYSVSVSKQERSKNKFDKKRPKRIRTDFSSDKGVISIRVKDSTLGNSVRVLDMSPYKMQKKLLQPQVQTRPRATTKTMTRDRNLSILNSMVLTNKQQTMKQFLSKRSQLLKLNHLDKILSTLVPNQNVATLRIYKDKIKKFYANRYKKQKITIFFDYQYIQDYDSQLKYLQSLLSMKIQQIYFLCFLVLDQNGDGLICNNDLFSLTTTTNPLINKDIFKIYQCVNFYQHMSINTPFVDPVSDQELFKPENTNLQKYRLMEFKIEKEREKNSKRKDQDELKVGLSLKRSSQVDIAREGKSIVTRKTYKHLFSTRMDEEEGQQAIKQLRKKFAEDKLTNKSRFHFKINFNRFKTIFTHCIPDTYFDILYAQGGIKLPNKEYLPLNYEIQEQTQKKEISQILIDRYFVAQDRIQNMKQTYKKNRIQRLSKGSHSSLWGRCLQ